MSTLADDPLVAYMKKRDIEVTRENWIDMNWGATPPDPWDAEAEAQLPDELQETVPDDDEDDDDGDEEAT